MDLELELEETPAENEKVQGVVTIDPDIITGLNTASLRYHNYGNTLQIHEYAEIYPPLDNSDYNNLLAAIEKRRKVIVPIVLLDGKVIDGRHRARAIQDLWDTKGLDVEYSTVDYDRSVDGDPIDYVHDLNFNRRQLTTTQRAAIGLKLMRLFAEQTTPGRKKAGEKAAGEARERAAKLVGISGKAISTYASIEEHSPQLVERMSAGEITVFQAAAEQKREREQAEHGASAAAGHPPKPEDEVSWEIILRTPQNRPMSTMLSDVLCQSDVIIQQSVNGIGGMDHNCWIMSKTHFGSSLGPAIQTSFALENSTPAEAKRKCFQAHVTMHRDHLKEIAKQKAEDRNG